MFADELFDLIERSAEFFDGSAAEISFLNGEPSLGDRGVAGELIHLQDKLEMLPALLPLVNEERPSADQRGEMDGK